MTALRALMAGSIDYAGLFPPAELDMATAAANYAAYRTSDAAWALGRLVVPSARLSELEAARTQLPLNPDDHPWRLSALLGADPTRDLRAIEDFICRQTAGRGGAVVDVVEGKAGTVEAITALLDVLPRSLEAYIEVPAEPDPAPLISAIADRGARAKIRTGGVTSDAFPSAAHVARFIGASLRAGVPFKATAGLHHPIRAEYPLTYAKDSPRGVMFGFLNVFLAAAFMAGGMAAVSAIRLLEESAPASITVSDRYIEWRGHRLDETDIMAARGRAIVSFGSCSFTEPIGDLAALGLL
ncbi:MAG TPA: hypothetical protein VIG08_16305 [Gemmatimonadales bacterium]|jgi:hypothetical protein